MSETKRKKEPWEIDLDRELEEVMRDELDGYNRFAEDDDWEADFQFHASMDDLQQDKEQFTKVPQ